MRIRRGMTFVSGLARAVVKAVVTSVVLAALTVSLLHYMSVPIPDLIGGLSELAEVLS